MKALLLNSGLGSRMGALTKNQPKCMTELTDGETILSRQLRLLSGCGIQEAVITTGAFDEAVAEYCKSLELPLDISFVKNPLYDRTNYIYSIYCARELLRDEDIVLIHGDLVFEYSVLCDVLRNSGSCMAVDCSAELPEKDFKAVVRGSMIEKVGIEFFDDAVTAQPLYKLDREDWAKWLEKMIDLSLIHI